MSNRPEPNDPNDLPPQMPDPLPDPLIEAQFIELEQKLTFQQRSFEELNSVVLQQQLELERLGREVKSLRQLLQGLENRGVGDDLPHEKPPHY